MDFTTFNTGKNDISRRLDKVIRIFEENLSLAEIYKAIRKGLIKVNNRKTKSDYRIQENDIISIASFLINKADRSEIGDNRNTGTNDKILKNMPEIIFENDYILIINKPYDINVHGDKNSLDRIIEEYYYKKNNQDSLSFRPGPLHRLDKKTTGLLAFSMNIDGARWFSENIKNHSIQKKYYGLIEGKLSEQEEWIDFISKENNSNRNERKFHKVHASEDRREKTASCNDINEKKAETVVTPVATGRYMDIYVTLAEFHIKTGRKHQIRAQSSLHKHPLLGDTAYGGHKINYGKQDFYLTAKELIFPKNNPVGLPEKIIINLGKNFVDILKYCDIKKIGV